MLEGVGIDVRNMKDTEVAARVRDIVETQRGAAEGTTRPTAERVATERATEAAGDLDAVREQEVRQLFEGRENEVITVEREDGTVQQMTVREMFEDFEQDENDLAAIAACVGRSRG